MRGLCTLTSDNQIGSSSKLQVTEVTTVVRDQRLCSGDNHLGFVVVAMVGAGDGGVLP